MKNNQPFKIKTPTQFQRLGDILNPEGNDFETVFVARDYAVETLINGNVSECVKYLRELIGTGIIGIKEASEQMIKIKERCPDRYDYINDNVYKYR